VFFNGHGERRFQYEVLLAVGWRARLHRPLAESEALHVKQQRRNKHPRLFIRVVRL